MRFAASLVMMLLLLAGTAAAETVTVAVSKAELRSKPAVAGSTVVKTLPIHTPLAVQKTENRYLQVKDFKGTVGWIHQSLVGEQKAVTIANENINIRKAPAKDQPVVFKAQRGEAFLVLEESGDWLKIGDGQERTGWTLKSLVWGL